MNLSVFNDVGRALLPNKGVSALLLDLKLVKYTHGIRMTFNHVRIGCLDGMVVGFSEAYQTTKNMFTTSTTPLALLGILSSAKKTDEVDKGTTRKTPGESEGAQPPKKEDFREIERENDRKNDVQEETVDNEERDKNR